MRQYPPSSALERRGEGLNMPWSPSPARGVPETHSWMKAGTSGLYSPLGSGPAAGAGLLPARSRLLHSPPLRPEDFWKQRQACFPSSVYTELPLQPQTSVVQLDPIWGLLLFLLLVD